MTYDDKHHAYEGNEAMGEPCRVCEQSDVSEVHQSYEQFSKECDEVFGK